jgi:uncharacterized membrane-anchored protein YhcB (DUF1043 family)
MYDFVVGLAFGTILVRVLPKKKRKDVSTQVDFVSVAVPIPIPKRSFVPGALANFWGSSN